MATPPSVYRYLNYRNFLTDWFAAWQKQKRKNSHRSFSTAADVGPGTLSNVLQGHRHASPETLEHFNRVIGLNEEELAFLKLLAELAEAPTLERRAELLAQIFGNQHFQQVRRVEGQMYHYFSKWYNVAIREMVAIPGFTEDLAWIAERLSFQVSEEEVRTALDELLAVGLITRGPDGRLHQQELRLDSTDSATGAEAYHRSMLEQALVGLKMDPNQRYYGAVTMTVPEHLIPILRQETIAFLRRTLDLCDGDQPPAEGKVIQLNVQLFPLSL